VPAGNNARSPLVRFVGEVLARVSDFMGGPAVSLFFVLSGFILVYVYASNAGSLRGPQRAFYVARFARIYPVYLVGLALALGPYLLWHTCASGNSGCATSMRLPVILSSLVLLQGWDPMHLLYLNGPGWSLSDEAFFYALFPALIPLVARVRTRHLLALIAGLCAVALLPPLLYAIFRPDGAHVANLWDAFWFQMTYYCPLLRLPDFVVGVALGWLFVQRQREGTTVAPSIARLKPGVGESIVLLALTMLVIIGVIPVLLPSLALDPLLDTLLLPVMAALIYTTAWSQGSIARVLGSGPLVLLGEASYGLYILHWPLWIWYTRLLHQPSTGYLPRLPSLALFALYLVMLIGLSVACFRFVETPLRIAIRRAFAQRRMSLPRVIAPSA
jgi:peptidoglycan/LPS O-acetylase OafA/YrhL